MKYIEIKSEVKDKSDKFHSFPLFQFATRQKLIREREREGTLKEVKSTTPHHLAP